MPYRVIGKGEEALVSFIEECIKAKGSPTVVGRYGVQEFEDRVLVRCFGASDKVPGGFIVGLKPETVKKVRERKLDAKWILEELKKKK